MADLVEIPCEPLGRGIGEMIAELSAQHAKGELSGLVVAVVYRDGTTQRAFSDLRSTATMIGAVERLKHVLIRRLEDDA